MAVLFIAVVVIVAGGLFLLLNNKGGNNVPESPAVPNQPVTQPATPNPSTNYSSLVLKTYISAKSGISFNYPAAWMVKEISDGGHVIISGGPQSQPELFYISTDMAKLNCTGKDCLSSFEDAPSKFGLTKAYPAIVGTALNSAFRGYGYDMVTYLVKVGDRVDTIQYADGSDDKLQLGLDNIVSSIKF